MLTYDITNEWLSGDINGKKIALFARSGGGRGSKVHPEGQADQMGLASWNTQRKENSANGIRGGPIPSGFYVVHKPAQHPPLGLAAYLEQTVTSLIYANPSSPTGVSVTARDALYIHNRGPKGSDGCIVPMEKFADLMALLTANAPIVLQVVYRGVRTDKLPSPAPANIA